ncbi:hypothetical protein P7C71_g3824, partial [Lecanoromycetidae sp. Uapishka_2]
MRSRTGCLTCRQRKLKCDEQKPICGQCSKANRHCEASTGLTFRHQHNASMNANRTGSGSEGNPSLSGFYSYKNTFDRDTVWLDVPKQLTFFNTTNPYLDPGTPDLDGNMQIHGQLPYAPQQQEQWQIDNQLHDQSLELPLEMHPFGLEALSHAALYRPPQASFGSYVPVQTRSHALLEHAACACAAKHLGRAKGAKAVTGGVCSQHTSMELYADSSIDWEYERALHYDRSIALPMDAMRQD